MSNVFDAIAWAIKVSRGEPMPARMLLIVGMAQRVGDNTDGFVVWPSVGQLCADTDMSRTSVKKWTRHLEEKGLVEVFQTVRENGSSGSNRYRLPIKAVFYHPTKGAMDEEGSPSDRGVGRHPTGEGSVDSTGGGSPARPGIEHPLEHPLEDRGDTPADELNLGIPPVPPKDPTPSDVADFIAERWAARAFATPLRGGTLSEANAEKARDLGKKHAVGKGTALDTWTEIFERIDTSDFLQGKVSGREGRPPFKLTLSFLLEKRNFEKTLEGRFNGQSTGERRRGSTSEATGRVVERIRSGAAGRTGGGNQAVALARD